MQGASMERDETMRLCEGRENSQADRKHDGWPAGTDRLHILRLFRLVEDFRFRVFFAPLLAPSLF